MTATMKNSLGVLQQQYLNKDFESAKKTANQILKTYPHQTLALFVRGLCREALEDTEGAMEDYQQVLKLDPNYRAAALKHAQCLVGQFQLDTAIEELDALAERNPDWPEVFRERATVHNVLQDYPSQAADLLRVIELGGETAEIRFERFKALVVYEDYAVAYRDLDRAIELDPENEEYRRERSRNYSDDFDRTLDLRWLVKRYPDDIELEAALIREVDEKEKYERVTELERKVGRLPPDIQSYMAAVAYTGGRYEEAAMRADQYLSQVVAEDVDDLERILLGQYFIRVNRVADAIKQFSYPSSSFRKEQTVYSADIYEVLRYSWLARCKVRQNQKATARELWEKANQLAQPFINEDNVATDILNQVKEELDN